MAFLVTAACMIAAACVCVLSYIAANKRLEAGAALPARENDSGEDAPEPSGPVRQTGAAGPAGGGPPPWRGGILILRFFF